MISEAIVLNTLVALLTLALVAGSCAPRTSERTLANAPSRSAGVEPSVIRINVTDAGSPDVAIAENDEVVDFAMPRGCEKIYDPKDACKTLRGLIDTQLRMNNRACLSRLSAMIPGYGTVCRWTDFSNYVGGFGADCYSHRFSGAGVVCAITDDQHPDDASTHFASVEKTVRACLDGWSFEQTAKTRVFIDVGFSMSNRAARTAAPGAVENAVTRVQACRFTEESHSIDERPRPYVWLEVFTESANGAGR
jgi:hypothetical protein